MKVCSTSVSRLRQPGDWFSYIRVALQHTGGGQFFIDFAFALFGRVRGGPAKVSIISSGLMGSMSGSVINNVLTTGQLTIPAMKKSGITPRVAAGVEACASTGGVLLPPVMGSTAFAMATFRVPYYQVAVAAAVSKRCCISLHYLSNSMLMRRGSLWVE